MFVESVSFNTIKRRPQFAAPTIIRWEQRFLTYGQSPLSPEGTTASSTTSTEPCFYT
jgi:hypothetical protein